MVHSLKVAGAALAAVLAAATPNAASAAAIVQTQSIPSQSTNWLVGWNFNKFDTGLGTLINIIVSITGNVTGQVQMENGSGSAAVLTGTLQATQTVSAPALAIPGLVNNIPAVSTSFNATAFDGTNDFGGTSGVTVSGLSDTDTTSTTFNNSNFFWNLVYVPGFTCTGVACLTPIAFQATAVGNSSSTGSGTIINSFTTNSAATVSLTYNYAPPTTTTPEPASLAMIGMGMLGLGLLRRRRRSN